MTNVIDDQDRVLRARLPALYKELFPAISISTLLALSDAFGGTEIYVPHRPRARSKLSRVLNQGEFTALCELIRGAHVVLPMATSLRRAIRAGQVLAALSQGKSAREIALNLKMSARNVYRIKARAAMANASSRRKR